LTPSAARPLNASKVRNPFLLGDEERLAGGLRAARREELLRNGHLERPTARGHHPQRIVLATVVAQQEKAPPVAASRPTRTAAATDVFLLTRRASSAR
jgi:hypothetical protein